MGIARKGTFNHSRKAAKKRSLAGFQRVVMSALENGATTPAEVADTGGGLSEKEARQILLDLYRDGLAERVQTDDGVLYAVVAS